MKKPGVIRLLVMVTILAATGLATFVFLDFRTAEKKVTDPAVKDIPGINRTYTDGYKMTEIVEECDTVKQGQEYSYLKYKLDHNTKEAVLIKADVQSPADVVTLPSILENYPVIQIGTDDDQTDLEGRVVFASTQKIDTLIIPEGIKTAGEDAFSGEQIREVFLPRSLNTIADSAFADSAICIVHVQNKNTDFGANCFADSSLKKIELPDGFCGSFAHGCFDHTLIREILWPAGDSEQNPKVPYDAFQNCKELTKVKFQSGPDQIFIPEYCFYGCKKLKKLVFPAKIKKIKMQFTPYAENNRKAAPGTLVVRGKNTVIESTGKRNGKNLFGAEQICAPQDAKAFETAGKSFRIRSLSKKMLRCADQEWGVNESSLKPEQAEYAWMKRKILKE